MSGFGILLAFELACGGAAAFIVLNNLQLMNISKNLGDNKPMACHRCTTTQSNMSAESRASLGITVGHIRLSVGLEDAVDLIKDLEQALTWVGAGQHSEPAKHSTAQKYPFSKIDGCVFRCDSVN